MVVVDAGLLEVAGERRVGPPPLEEPELPQQQGQQNQHQQAYHDCHDDDPPRHRLRHLLLQTVNLTNRLHLEKQNTALLIDYGQKNMCY